MVPLPGKYTLNHYPKTEKSFSGPLLAERITHVWQLVPDIFSLDVETPDTSAFSGLSQGFRVNTPDAAWQQEGYWHIARAQVHSRKYGLELYYYNDLANNLRTGHMDVTFQPVYYAMPYRDVHNQNTKAIFVPVAKAAIRPAQAHNVFNMIGSNKRDRQELRLEQGFNGNLGDIADIEGAEKPRSNGSTVTVHHEDIIPSPMESDAIGDIGVFDDPGPLSLSSYSVAKPGLKSLKKRAKGMSSSILAVDGSVTIQHANML